MQNNQASRLQRLGSAMAKHPYLSYISLSVASFATAFGLATYPTEKKVAEHKKAVAGAAAYAKALPGQGIATVSYSWQGSELHARTVSQGDTVESVFRRMKQVQDQHGRYAMPVDSERGAVTCLEPAAKLSDGYDETNLRGNYVFVPLNFPKPVDPQTYFNCLKAHQPKAHDPQQLFNDMTLKAAPVVGLLVGGVLGVIASPSRRRKSGFIKPVV